MKNLIFVVYYLVKIDVLCDGMIDLQTYEFCIQCKMHPKMHFAWSYNQA